MPKPNFFIVGAPKCGTSSLYHYLRQHPEVFMSEWKEPRFFAKDLDSGTPRDEKAFVRDLDAYLQLFEEAGSARRIGEASALYLYSKEAARNIKNFCPKAKIVVMLRNPVDVMYGFHQERFYYENEDIADFKEALNAEPERRMGRKLPPRGSITAALQYRDVARFSEQIERYFEHFGRESVHVILFDEFKNHTERCYEDTLSFLDLRKDFRPEFEIWNSSKQLRSESLVSLMREPPPIVQFALRVVVPSKVRRSLRKRIRRLNTIRGGRPPLDPDLRYQLTVEMKPEVERLGRLIGRDLSHWSDVGAEIGA